MTCMQHLLFCTMQLKYNHFYTDCIKYDFIFSVTSLKTSWNIFFYLICTVFVHWMMSQFLTALYTTFLTGDAPPSPVTTSLHMGLNGTTRIRHGTGSHFVTQRPSDPVPCLTRIACSCVSNQYNLHMHASSRSRMYWCIQYASDQHETCLLHVGNRRCMLRRTCVW